MGYKLTTHFTSDEFKCKCCGAIKMDPQFMARLETMREIRGRPMFISSGFRCENHNEKVGGVPTSFHLKGRAADIVCLSSVDRYELVRCAIEAGFRGIGIDKTFVHVDNRETDVKKMWAY